MLATLRRSGLALTLTLVVPGLVPSWVQVTDPCPDMAPWLEDGHAGGHQRHTGHGTGSQGGERSAPGGQSGHHQGCTCLGACQVGTGEWSPAPPQANATALSLTVQRVAPRTGITLSLTTPDHTLPPATAPPLG